MDGDGSGHVTHGQFLKVLSRIMKTRRSRSGGGALRDEERRVLLGRFDTNLDSTIDYREFLRFCEVDAASASPLNSAPLLHAIRKLRRGLAGAVKSHSRGDSFFHA